MFKMWYFCVYAANCQVFFALFLILYKISFHFHPSPPCLARSLSQFTSLHCWCSGFRCVIIFLSPICKEMRNFTYVRGLFFVLFIFLLQILLLLKFANLFLQFSFCFSSLFAIKRMKIRRQRKRDSSYKHIITIVVITSYI